MDIKYPVLAGEIARRGIKKKAIAQACGLSEKSFYNRMAGKNPFTWPETRIIQSTFFPDIPKEKLFEDERFANGA